MKAHEILNAAAGHLADRAKTYDKPEGERSMAATIEAFKAVTGVSITETQGWLFMALLKAVRSQQNAFKLDSFEDGAAYFALAGESASKMEFGSTEAVKSEKPSWNDAPEWAQWVAQDCAGDWYFYKKKPFLKDGFQNWREPSLTGKIIWAESGKRNPNWRETLEQRPSNDGWIEWNGGECPVDVSTVVQVSFKGKDGIEKIFCPAGELRWSRRGFGEIIAYRVIK